MAALVLLTGTLGDTAPAARAQELAAPRIWLEADCAAPSGEISGPDITVNVHGHNFTPDTTVELFHWFRDPDNQSPDLSVPVDSYGTFDTSFVLPTPARPGSYTIRAFYAGNRRAPAATVDFLVPCPPSVTVTPDCADPPPVGQQLEIRVEGRNWIGREFFTVSFRDLADSRLAEETVRVVGGSFSATLRPPLSLEGPVPALLPGLYAIFVVDVQAPSWIALFSVPCDYTSVTLGPPDCGDAGSPPDRYAIGVSGTGFAPIAGSQQPGIVAPPRGGNYIEILFDVDGRREEFLVLDGVPEGGGWGPLTISPFMRTDGTYNVRVRQYASGFLLLERTATFSVPCPPDPVPRIEVDPVCGPPAFDGEEERFYDVTIRGFEFLPGATVSVTFDAIGLSGLPVLTGTATVGEDGQWEHFMQPARRPPDTYQVHVRQETEGAEVLIAEFSVPCEPKTPALTARCEPPEPADPAAAQVLIEGVGFFEDAPLFLVVAGGPEQLLRTEPDGSFSHVQPAAGLPAGAVDVLAVQRNRVPVVLAQAAATPPLVLPCGTPPEPMLRVVPSTTSPGTVVLVEGLFFTPGETVGLTWTEGIGAGVSLPATVGADGIFRVQVLIFHRDFVGPREVTAAPLDDPAAAYTEPAALLVVPGRGSPPAFVVDGTQGPIVIRR